MKDKKFLIAMWYLFSGHGSSEFIAKTLNISRKELLERSIDKIHHVDVDLREELRNIDY